MNDNDVEQVRAATWCAWSTQKRIHNWICVHTVCKLTTSCVRSVGKCTTCLPSAVMDTMFAVYLKGQGSRPTVNLELGLVCCVSTGESFTSDIPLSVLVQYLNRFSHPLGSIEYPDVLWLWVEEKRRRTRTRTRRRGGRGVSEDTIALS